METKQKKIPWWIQQNKPNPGNNAMTGKIHTPETKIKIGNTLIIAYQNGKVAMHGKKHKFQSILKIQKNHPDTSFEKNPMWKGDNVGYGGVHSWIIRKKGQPYFCEGCGKNSSNINYEWSNKSRIYKRDLNDWQRLCVPCHRKYDRIKKREREEVICQA